MNFETQESQVASGVSPKNQNEKNAVIAQASIELQRRTTEAKVEKLSF